MHRSFLVPFVLLLAGCDLTRGEQFALVFTLLCWAGFFVYCHNADAHAARHPQKKEERGREEDDDDDPPATGGTVLPVT